MCKLEEENGKIVAVSFKFCYLNVWNSLETFFIVRLDEGCSIKALMLTPSLELYHANKIIESFVWFGF
jgi:hypothetical protein